MSQTSYALEMDKAFAGLKADLDFDRVISASAEAAVIAFGTGLDEGTIPGDQVITYDGTGSFRGIALHQHKEDGQYNIFDTVNVLRRGLVWVVLVAAMTIAEGDSVYCVKDAGATQGHFRNTVDASADIIAGAVFHGVKTTRDSVDIAIVEINLP